MADKLWVLASLLLVLGAVLVGVAVTTGGSGTKTVYQYTAYEVDHDGKSIVLTSTKTGKEITDPSRTVDDRVVCLREHSPGDTTRLCKFEEQAMRGEISPNSSVAKTQFEYLYLDGEFYRANSSYEWEQRPRGYAQNSTDPAEAFDDLAIGSYRLTPDEREAIEDGPIRSTYPLPHADRIVEYDGDYYLLTVTARQTPGDADAGTVSSCWSIGSHDDACSDLITYQQFRERLPIGLGLLGALGIGIGGLGLWRLRTHN